TPEKARLRVYHGGRHASLVAVPVVPAKKARPPRFLPPPRLQSYVRSSSEPPRQQVLHDQITGAVTVLNRTASTLVRPAGGGEMLSEHGFHCTASSKDPTRASIIGTHTYVLKRDDGTVKVTAESTIKATATAFHITINLTVTRNGLPFFQKTWMTS